MTKYVCNPKTGRVIQVNGSTFKSLSKNAKYKQKLARSPKSTSKKTLTPCKSPRRPKKSRRRRTRRTPVKCGNPKGWGALKPGGHERTVMMKKCGKHCFLGHEKTFPICAAGSCRHSPLGISAACIRARQMSSPRARKVKGRSKNYYNRIAQRALGLRGGQSKSSGGALHRHHQGYDDREDESLGMRTGAEHTKHQTFKDRRDESYGDWGTRGGLRR